ncbi:MAG TPA: ABC transporter substrate-binding protein [Casimicrobiaceae bacterium]|nr:ABC transporter substrate-binding protein [Casimicrobiaceae bacterium]
MKRAITALLLAAVAIGAAPLAAQTKVTIGTARDPNLGAQIVIAREKGYFRDAGLDADIKYFPSGGDLMSAFVGGSIAYGSAGATPVLTVRSRPFPLEIVAQISDISGAQQMLVKKSVNSLDALHGKKIGLLRGTASEALFNSVVKSYGFDASSVQLVNMGPAEMITAFIRGDVDSVVLWEPHTSKARKLGDGKTLISGTYSYLDGKATPRRVYGDHAVLFASQDTLKQQPAVTRALIGALQKANDFIEQHRADAVAILAKEYTLEPAEMDAIIDVNRYTLRLDDQMVRDFDSLAEFLYSIKRIPNPVHTRDAIDASALKAVKADLVTLQ